MPGPAPAASAAWLSLVPQFRRGHGALYDALALAGLRLRRRDYATRAPERKGLGLMAISTL